MNTSDLLLSLVIIIIFVLLYLYNILGVTIEKIKRLWPLYRCNPVIMPLAGFFGHNPTTNFNNCAQNIQKIYMSELLLPINYNINTISKAGNEINTSVLDTKSFINRFRNDISNIVKNIMSVFLNLTIDVETSNIKIKDVLSRLSATLTTLTYYSEGTLPTINSAKISNDRELKASLARERSYAQAQAQAQAEAQAQALADSEARAIGIASESENRLSAKNKQMLEIQADSEARITALNKSQSEAIALEQQKARDEALAAKNQRDIDEARMQENYNKQLQDIINWYKDRTKSADKNLQTSQIQSASANDACCFHPNTIVKTFNNKLFKIKDLKLSDRLKNGQKICAIMQINNLDNSNNFIEDLYLLKDGEQSMPILVSGSHLIFDESSMNYIHVKDHPKSVKSSTNSQMFICLITSDHTIPLGNYIFHDWEDNNGSPSKDKNC